MGMISLPLPALLFHYYYRNFATQRLRFLNFVFLFIGLLLTPPIILIQRSVAGQADPFLKAFVYAALLEELLKFAMLRVLIAWDRRNLSPVTGILNAILLSTGFALAENLQYIAASAGGTSILRNISSIPMHIFSGGLMGFFLYLRALNQSDYGSEKKEQHKLHTPFFYSRTGFLSASALLLPWIYHGGYDYILLMGKQWHYALPFWLLLGAGGVQYALTRSRPLPDSNQLKNLRLLADEWELIFQQKIYESWMSNYHRWIEDPIRWLKKEKIDSWNIALFGFFTLLGFALLFVDQHFSHRLYQGARITQETRLALLFLLPESLGLVFLLADRLNIMVLHDFIMHKPVSIIAELNYTLNEISHSEDIVLFDLLPASLFLTARSDLPSNEAMTMVFPRLAKKKVRVSGRVVWINKNNPELPYGAIFRIESFGIDYLVLRISHTIQKMHRRLTQKDLQR